MKTPSGDVSRSGWRNEWPGGMDEWIEQRRFKEQNPLKVRSDSAGWKGMRFQPLSEECVALSNKHANVLLFWWLWLSCSRLCLCHSALYVGRLPIPNTAAHASYPAAAGWTMPTHSSRLLFMTAAESFHLLNPTENGGPQRESLVLGSCFRCCWCRRQRSIHISPFIFHLINCAWCLSVIQWVSEWVSNSAPTHP